MEDQRAALEVDRQALIGVANQIGFCNQALVGLIQTLDSGFQPSTSEVQGAVTECAAADEAIGSYNANYWPVRCRLLCLMVAALALAQGCGGLARSRPPNLRSSWHRQSCRMRRRRATSVR